MNILVINGSPAGKDSITLQTALYWEKLFPEQHFTVLHAAQRIRALERDFAPAAEAMRAADLLLFCYPVYTFLAPSQLHRFIELTKAAEIDLSDKLAAQLTTSKHFYDTTAHRYIEENCFDLGLSYLDGFSADMEDLLSETGQKQAEAFFRRLLFKAERGYRVTPPEAAPAPIHIVPAVPAAPQTDKPGRIVVLADRGEEDTSLNAMIDRFIAVCPRKVEVVELREFPFSGGCLGCFRCAVSGRCVYKDGFDSFLREHIQTAEAIVPAFTVRDHSMGSLFKLYDDRQFCNGHRTVTEGTPFGYLVSGALSREENLKTVLEARAQVGGNCLAGIAGDERDTEKQIDTLAEELCYAVEQRYCPPRNFYGVGGMKIFRDLIFLMQGMMRADHRFFKSHGQYDFPQKKRGQILKMYLVGQLLSSEKLRKASGDKITEGMVGPYRKVLEHIPDKR